MTKKDEVNQKIGEAVTESFKTVAKEAAKEQLTGNAKVMQDLLDEVVSQQQRVTLRIYRKGVGLLAGKEEYLTQIQNVDPEMLRDGVEQAVKDMCGGGDYRINMTADGVKSRNVNFVIAGDPKTKTEAEKSLGVGPNMVPGPFGMLMQVPGGGYMANPFQATFPGMSPSPSPSKDNTTDAMQMLMMLHQMENLRRNSSTENEEVKALRETVLELKSALASKEQDRLRQESEARHAAEIAELRSAIMVSASSAPKQESTTDKLLTAAIAALPVLFQSRATEQATQMQLMGNLMTAQKDSSKDALELMKVAMTQPKESETDRMAKVMEIATQAMSTTMGLTQAMVNQMASMQPEAPKWWQEILMNVAGQIGDLGQAVLASRKEKSEEPTPRQIAPGGMVKVLPSAARAQQEAVDESQSELLDVASAAAAAAQQKLATPTPDEEDQNVRVAGLQQQVPLPDFSAGAFKQIFSLIQADAQGNFTGDVHEIAFRIWKHASSGNKEALDWVKNPEEYTIIVLDQLAKRGDILVTAERIEEMAEAMVEMFEHFTQNGTAEQYIAKHKLSIPAPKKMVVVPLTEADSAEEDEETEEEETEEKEASLNPPPPPAPEQPKAPAVATPSFGASPPTLKTKGSES